MTKVGDEIEIGGVRCVVVAVGPLYLYRPDENGVERQVEAGRFVHVERADVAKAPG